VEAVCLRLRATIARDTNDASGALAYGLQAQAALGRAESADPVFEAGLIGDVAYAEHLNGRAEDAERMFRDSLARFQAAGRPEHPDAVAIRDNWANHRFQTGDVLGALALEDEALDIARRHAAGGEPPLGLLADRALSLDALARFDEAEAGFDAVLTVAERRGDAAAMAYARIGKAKVRLGRGDVAGAEGSLATALAGLGALPPDNPASMNAAVVRARIAAARGRLEEADQAFSKLVEFWDSRGVRTGATWSALRDRSDVRLRLGRTEAASQDAARAFEIARSVQGGKPFSSLTGLSLSLQARIEVERERRDEARRLARLALDQLTRALGPDHPETRRARALCGA
jgi:tetratricopeptide (TPR) repeat protein